MITPQVITAAIIVFVVLLAFITILRWLFRIDRMVNNQTAIVWLLIKMAERRGVPDEDIEKIKKAFYIK